MNVHMHTQLQLVRIKYIQKHVQRVTPYCTDMYKPVDQNSEMRGDYKWVHCFNALF